MSFSSAYLANPLSLLLRNICPIWDNDTRRIDVDWEEVKNACTKPTINIFVTKSERSKSRTLIRKARIRRMVTVEEEVDDAWIKEWMVKQREGGMELGRQTETTNETNHFKQSSHRQWRYRLLHRPQVCQASQHEDYPISRPNSRHEFR